MNRKKIKLLAVTSLLLVGLSANAQEKTAKKKKEKDPKKETEVVLDEVLISAIRAKTSTPMTFSNLSKKEIAKRNLGQDIPIMLNYLPSVVSSSDAGAGIGYTYMRVRGSDDSRINVTINGIPYNDPESQGTYWVNINDIASSVQSIQLQRGVGTSTNGAGAFGASLNILTDAVAEKAGGEFSSAVGSYNTTKNTLKFTTGKINKNFELAGRLSNIHSDGYIDRAFSNLQSYFLQGSYVDDKTMVKALSFGGIEQTYQAWYGLDATQLKENRRQNPYTYDNETDNYIQKHNQLHLNHKFNNQLSLNVGLNYTKGDGYFEQYLQDEEAANLNNLIVDGTDAIVRRWLDNNFYVINPSLNYIKGKMDLTVGVSASKYDNHHFGEVIWGEDLAPNTFIRDHYYDSNSDKLDLSGFVKTNFDLSKYLKVYVDLQQRHVNYKRVGMSSDLVALNINQSYNFFNPKAGVTYVINPSNNLYGSYARANREPNGNDFEAGTTKHESLNDFEFGWRLKKSKYYINSNVFFMDYKNQLVLSGEINNVGEPLRTSSGSSYRLGLEIDAQFNLDKYFSIMPNISLSSNKNRDFKAAINGQVTDLGNTPISNSPNVIIGNALVYKPVKDLEFTFLTKYVGEQYLGNFGGAISNIEKLESYLVNDLNVTYNIKTNRVFESIELKGLVNNLFNLEYVNRGYYYTYDDNWSAPPVVTTIDGAGFYPQATRNFLVGATFKF